MDETQYKKDIIEIKESVSKINTTIIALDKTLSGTVLLHGEQLRVNKEDLSGYGKRLNKTESKVIDVDKNAVTWDKFEESQDKQDKTMHSVSKMTMRGLVVGFTILTIVLTLFGILIMIKVGA